MTQIRRTDSSSGYWEFQLAGWFYGQFADPHYHQKHHHLLKLCSQQTCIWLTDFEILARLCLCRLWVRHVASDCKTVVDQAYEAFLWDHRARLLLVSAGQRDSHNAFCLNPLAVIFLHSRQYVEFLFSRPRIFVRPVSFQPNMGDALLKLYETAVWWRMVVASVRLNLCANMGADQFAAFKMNLSTHSGNDDWLVST